MTALYFFHSSSASQRVRLALGYKQVAYTAHALDYDDDETFFNLGLAREVPILVLADGRRLTDSIDILAQIDDLFVGPALRHGVIDDAAWAALLDWRRRVDALFARLQAPALAGYADIAVREASLADYKAAVQRRFGQSLEELSNDRYAAFEQLAAQTRLPELARHLARERFYVGRPSIADMVIAADFYPLQLLDGVTLPLDLMYYLERVAEVCGVDLREGVLAA